jgi:hypothetical protein
MATPEVSLDELEAALRRLPVRRRKEVLLFIEFLEYETLTNDDDRSDDDDLWKAVLAHQEYRKTHPAEQPEEYDSPEAFLQATPHLTSIRR